jgi:hypothetical protein
MLTLLSLEDEAVEVRRWLASSTFHLTRAVLVGNPAPVVQRMYARIYAPQVGDLVVEYTSIWRSVHGSGVKPDWYRGVGVLLAHRKERPYPDADWTDEAWYVQYGPADEDVCRWADAQFVVIPQPGERFEDDADRARAGR